LRCAAHRARRRYQHERAQEGLAHRSFFAFPAPGKPKKEKEKWVREAIATDSNIHTTEGLGQGRRKGKPGAQPTSSGARGERLPQLTTRG
jgi:hypothetical protein